MLKGTFVRLLLSSIPQIHILMALSVDAWRSYRRAVESLILETSKAECACAVASILQGERVQVSGRTVCYNSPCLSPSRVLSAETFAVNHKRSTPSPLPRAAAVVTFFRLSTLRMRHACSQTGQFVL